MRKHGIAALVSTILCLSLGAIALSSCASAGAHQRSALENAKLAFADGAIGYTATMQSLSDLRAAHKVTDAQWQAIDLGQRIVAAVAPRVRASLSLWEQSGSKPLSYDQIVGQFAAAVRDIARIATEVKK